MPVLYRAAEMGDGRSVPYTHGNPRRILPENPKNCLPENCPINQKTAQETARKPRKLLENCSKTARKLQHLLLEKGIKK